MCVAVPAPWPPRVLIDAEDVGPSKWWKSETCETKAAEVLWTMQTKSMRPTLAECISGTHLIEQRWGVVDNLCAQLRENECAHKKLWRLLGIEEETLADQHDAVFFGERRRGNLH